MTLSDYQDRAIKMMVKNIFTDREMVKRLLSTWMYLWMEREADRNEMGRA